MPFKTFSPTPNDVNREWWVIDAQGMTLGRLSSRVAMLLKGKHKATYTTHMDMGDFVVIINADKIHVTGDRLDTKEYHRHSGYIGSLRTLTLREMLQKHPERVIEIAVKGMLPKNALGHQMIKKLKVYTGSEHPHTAQNPKPFDGIQN
jgi:large subunit ribosomal protein L13